MPTQYLTHTNKTIQIEDQPLGDGGEANVYNVLSGTGKDNVAKIYKDVKKAARAEAKLQFMVSHSPIANQGKEIQEAIVWPEELLYNNKGVFVGYTMPKVQDVLTLTHLSSTKSNALDNNVAWQKFSRSQPNSYIQRLKVCYNLAQAINVLHQSGNYVLVDLKPDNLLIRKDGTIAIIDLDSIQISENGKLLFSAPVATDMFAPPEYHFTNINSLRQVEWDYFIYAVVVYQILLGIHPFQGSHPQYSTIPELIKAGLFANGHKSSQYSVIPAPHKEFSKLDKSIQGFFMRTFEQGIQNPQKRTSFNEWYQELLQIIVNFKPRNQKQQPNPYAYIHKATQHNQKQRKQPKANPQPQRPYNARGTNRATGNPTYTPPPPPPTYQAPRPNYPPPGARRRRSPIRRKLQNPFGFYSKILLPLRYLLFILKVLFVQLPIAIYNTFMIFKPYSIYLAVGFLFLLISYSDGFLMDIINSISLKNITAPVYESTNSNSNTLSGESSITLISEKESTDQPSNSKTNKKKIYPPESGGLYLAYLPANDKYFYQTAAGKVRTNEPFENAKPFHYERAGVMKNGKWGYINASGTLIVSYKFDDAGSFYRDTWKNEDLAKVRFHGYELLINKFGDIVEGAPDNEIFRIQRNGKYSFIDFNKRRITNEWFNDAGHFHFGRARVKRDGQWGYIDIHGEVCIDFMFDEAKDFTESIWSGTESAIVHKNGQTLNIDKDGNVL